MYGVNKFLFTNKKNPWGCTEYIDMAGNLQMDIVIQRFLGRRFFQCQIITRNFGLSILAERIKLVIQNTRSGCLMMKVGHQDFQLHSLQGLFQLFKHSKIIVVEIKIYVSILQGNPTIFFLLKNEIIYVIHVSSLAQ